MEVGRGAVSHLVKAHYLHRWPGVVTATLALMDGSEPIGAIVFALPPRETMKRYSVPLAWELARLFIVDGTPKNTETWFVSRAIKWVQVHRPGVALLVSYADPGVGHRGTIYRAGNWIEEGKTEDKRTPREDYVTQPPDDLFGTLPPKKHGRRGHISPDQEFSKIPRVSKWRFIYWMDGKHEKRRQQRSFTTLSGPAVPGVTLPVYSDPLAGKSVAKNGDCTQRTGPVEGEGSRGNNPESREPSGESPLAGKPDVQPSGQIPERSAKFGMSDLRTANLPLL